jgi:PTH1 family peptidyl-tRNA hydrolase
LRKDSEKKVLIVGLGNPGKKYELTRHNIGFNIIDACAKQLGALFKKKKEFEAEFAKVKLDTIEVLLLKPQTFMNLSGTSVQKCARFYEVLHQNILVIFDDVYLKFGQMRLRAKGSSGGHNGVENIIKELNSQTFCRLRFGIGEKTTSDLEAFVMGHFTQSEQGQLEELISKAVQITESWTTLGLEKALHKTAQHKTALLEKGKKDEKAKKTTL